MTTFLAQIVHHLPLRLQLVVAVVLDEAGPALLDGRMLSLRLPAALIRVSGETLPGALIGRHWQVEVVPCGLWLAAGTRALSSQKMLKYFALDFAIFLTLSIRRFVTCLYVGAD